jgi:hypothetical protein
LRDARRREILAEKVIVVVEIKRAKGVSGKQSEK